MMNSSVHPATSSAKDQAQALGSDDDTIVTPPRGGTTNPRERLCVEKTLKFRFVPPDDQDGVHPAILHVHWMNEVQSTFGDDIQFFDNRNRQVKTFDPIRTDPVKHIQQFQLLFDRRTQNRLATSNKKTNEATPDPRRVTSYMVHRIRTSISLSEIKATFTVMKLMNDHKFYVNEHRWSEMDWETTQLGFIYGIDPQFHDLDQATNKVMKTIQQNTPRAKIPKFRLVYCSPKIRNAKGRIVRTKAYAIETLRDDRDLMTQVLKNAYKESGVFISFQMRNRHPEAFERVIKAQTHMISTNYVVVINNIGPDAMHYLSDRINAIEGVLSLLPCKSVNEDGKYKVLVHQKNYHRIRDYLKDVIPKWYDEYVEPDAKAPEGRYPGKPEVSQNNSDGYSQGDNSYMNISVNTAMSLSSKISTDTTSPPSYVYQRETNESTDTSTIDTSTLGDSRTHSSGYQPSWADAVKNSKTRPYQDIGTIPAETIQRSLETDLQNSRAEVAALKETIDQMKHESAIERERMEEKLKHQVDQALKVQFEAFAKEMTFQFAQMMMSQQFFKEKSATKRSALDLQEEFGPPASQMQIQRDDAPKRLDDKNTPHKQLTIPHDHNELETCQTPPIEERKFILTPWTGSPFTPQSKDSKNEVHPDIRTTLETQLSQSGDSDSNQHGSGNESTTEPSDYPKMEIEAQDKHDDEL